MELYRRLPIRTDGALDSDMVWRLHTLAIEYNLSAYDAGLTLSWLNEGAWGLQQWIDPFVTLHKGQG